MTIASTPALVQRNLIANLAGTGWSALLTLAVVPLYLRLLGPELYGLVGFFTTLQMLSLVLDRGLGTAANREMARLSTEQEPASRMRAVWRGLDLVYWIGAAGIAAVMAMGSRFVAVHWLRPETTSEQIVARAVLFMGLALAVQFPFGLYSGILLGLQHHVRYNIVLICGTTFRLLLPVAVLTMITSHDVVIFFICVATSAALQTLGARLLVSRALPPSEPRTVLDIGVGEVRRLAHFATGVTVLTGLTVVVLQIDKVLLSHLSPLQTFSYYAIAAAAASGIGVVSLPVYMVTFPRFSELLARGDRQSVEALYHRASQLMAALVLPAAAILIAFARPLLQMWTHDARVADAAARPLAFLAAAVCANSLTYVPLALQLAEGRPSFAIWLNAIGIAVLTPTVWYAAGKWDGPGAAAMVLLWNVAAMLAMAVAMNRATDRRSVLQWLSRDVGFPLAATVAISLLARLLAPHFNGWTFIIFIGVCAVTFVIASFSAAPVTWWWLRQRRRATRTA